MTNEEKIARFEVLISPDTASKELLETLLWQAEGIVLSRRYPFGAPEGITVSEEEVEAEYASMAEQYSLELDKIKGMVPAEEVKTSLETRKAVKVIVDSAVAVAPKAKEEATEE